jgi:hypothetical protein
MIVLFLIYLQTAGAHSNTQLLHLQDRLRPATQTADETVGLQNQIISAQTVKKLSQRSSSAYSNQIKCIYIALRTSADILKCCTETQPKTPNSKQSTV